MMRMRGRGGNVWGPQKSAAARCEAGAVCFHTLAGKQKWCLPIIERGILMRILAVDLGGARTGLAVCDKGEVLASPLAVVYERDRERLAEEVARRAKQEGAEEIVLGHPVNMDGSEGESALAARAFAETLRAQSGLPVVLRDERGTTITAHGYLNETDTRGKKRKAVVDAVAATIILEDYLAYRRVQRERRQEPSR